MMKYTSFITTLSLVVSLFSCSSPGNEEVFHYGKAFMNQKNGYSESVSVLDGKTKTIYVSGQIGEGEDLESQMRDALSNLAAALKTAGAEMKDIVKMNTYIVDYEPAMLDVFRGVRKEVMGDEKMPASTLLGVTALALPEWLIEIEAVAVVID